MIETNGKQRILSARENPLGFAHDRDERQAKDNILAFFGFRNERGILLRKKDAGEQKTVPFSKNGSQ